MSLIVWPHDRESRRIWKEVLQSTSDVWRECYTGQGHPIDLPRLIAALDQQDDDLL